MTRRYDVDWLRTLGVLLLVPFHSALMFCLSNSRIVYIKGECNDELLLKFASILDYFHMPLLFVLAGMSIYWSLRKRTKEQFLKERFIKLFIPLVIGTFIFNQLMTYIYLVSEGQEVKLINHFLEMFSKPLGDMTGRNGAFTVAHLWFVLYLLMFSVVGLPIYGYLKSEKSKVIREKLVSFLEKPLALLVLIMPYMLIYVVDILGWRNPFAYFYTVILGYLIATDERYTKALNRDKWIYLGIGTIEILVGWLGVWEISDTGWMILVENIVRLSARIIPVYALLGIFNSYFNKSNKLLQYLSKSSYTIYLIHMLINTVIGAICLPLPISSGLRWIIIVVLTYLCSFGIYEIINRISIYGNNLNKNSGMTTYNRLN